jgi:hypothetical protein
MRATQHSVGSQSVRHSDSVCVRVRPVGKNCDLVTPARKRWHADALREDGYEVSSAESAWLGARRGRSNGHRLTGALKPTQSGTLLFTTDATNTRCAAPFRSAALTNRGIRKLGHCTFCSVCYSLRTSTAWQPVDRHGWQARNTKMVVTESQRGLTDVGTDSRGYGRLPPGRPQDRKAGETLRQSSTLTPVSSGRKAIRRL